MRRKTYLEVISPILHPRMVGKNGIEPAGIKHPNFDTYLMIGVWLFILASCTGVYLALRHYIE